MASTASRSFCHVSCWKFSGSLGLSAQQKITAGQMYSDKQQQESPAVADKPARRLQKVCTVYVRAVGW